MANPTTNFNWQMPTNTDLVKDLPADFEVFGQAVDTSLMDLKGGTTGQILSKASNADMDFTWIANDQGDITAVTAGTGISGGGTSGAVTITNSMATAIDAKADLIVGTGSDAFTRLAAGNDGDQLLVDSSTTTGLRWQGNYAAGKNKIINGDFGIWQRGTTFAAVANNSYTADRWTVQTSGSGVTVSQQTFTLGTAPVAGYEGTYFLRMTNDGTSATCRIGQPIEDVRVFAGQTVTISFWAKSSISDVFTTSYILQGFGSGGSAQVATSLGTMPTVTSSWARYSITVAVPSIAGKTIGAGSSITFQLRLKASAAYDFDIWGVQVEAGNVATAFQTATGTVQGELAAAQRYYYRNSPNSVYGNISTSGIIYATTTCFATIQMPVQMRVTPTSLEFSNLQVFDSSITTYAITAATLATTNSGSSLVGVEFTSTGMTIGRTSLVRNNNNAAGYLGFSAEL